jgi:hypothetical protein
MLATFFVLWPFAAASLFAMARFFDYRDQQAARAVLARRGCSVHRQNSRY